MKNLLLSCIFALLFAASLGLRGTLEINEECKTCTDEQRRGGLCKPCRSNQDSEGKHSMYTSDHQTEDDSEEDDDDLGDYWLLPELRLVMIGHTGSGKSTTANIILGKKAFHAKTSAKGVTTRSQRGRALRFGRYIQIVDTPGLFDPKLNNTDVIKEVVKCIGMVSPGPHAFLLVIPIGRFSQEHKDTVTEFEKYMGKNIMRYIIVVFTRIGDLEEPLSEYVKEVPEKLEELLNETQFRYIGFDNKAPSPEKDGKVEELLSTIDKMIAGNGGDCYTSEIFAEAERKVKRMEEEMRHQLELEKTKEKENIEREFKKKMDEDREQHDKEVKRLKQVIEDLKDEDRQDGSMKAKIQEHQEQLRKQQEEMEERQIKDEEEMARLLSENEREYGHRLLGCREKTRQKIEKGMFQFLWDGLKAFYRKIRSSVFGG